MPMEIRGGVPRTRIATVDAAGSSFSTAGLGFKLAKWVRLRNTGGNEVRIYWTPEDYTADVNYMTLEANDTPSGVFEGPAEVATIWFKSAAGTTLEMTFFQRIG